MTDRSARRRILFSRDTLLGLVIVLLLAAVCVSLGMWQYGRYEDKRDRAAVIESNYDFSPVPLDEAMPDPAAALPEEQVWTPVQMQGTYCTDPGCVLYVRNRLIGGEVGFWQLVPFRAEDGTTLMVVRGWVPEDSDSSTPADPPPVPEGELTVTARLRTAEPVLDRPQIEGQAHSVNPTQISAQLGLEAESVVVGAYGELAAEDPEAERPQSLPSPDTGLGPHLSYAFQWWIFALFFPGALIFRLRRQFQDLAADEAAAEGASPGEGDDGREGADDPTDPHATTAPPARSAAPSRPGARDTTDQRPRRAVRTRRRGQDEEEEDALIDQQQP